MKFSKKHILLLILTLICVILQTGLDLTIPEYMAQITTLVQSEITDVDAVTNCGIKMLACGIGSAICAVVIIYCSAQLSAVLGREMRRIVFEKVIDFNNEEVEKFSISSLLTRTLQDVSSVQMAIILSLQTLIQAPLLFVWSVVKISDKSGQWTAITVGSIVILLVSLGVMMAITVPKFNKLQKLVDSVNRVTRENLNGIRVIRAYNAEKYQEDKFEAVNTDLFKTGLFADRIMTALNPILNGVLSGISLIVYWTGAFIIYEAAQPDKLPIFSDMMVYTSYALQVISSFIMMGGLLIMLPETFIHVKRIYEIMHTKVNMQNGDIAQNEPIETIEFKNVSFSYPEQKAEVLENVSFKINQGETVAIIGATGSGKSSLTNLLLRLYDVSDGEILINNRNIKQLETKSLRDKIGYVSQKAILFSGDIAQNVTYGQSYDADKMVRVLDIVQAGQFVYDLPERDHANVAQNGANYSGGQKQRLSIARAIYKNPEVLIFDDSFSALDYQTDAVLRKALDDNMPNVTKIIIAQRVGTIRDANKILVLENGKLVGVGSHHELMANCMTYKDIVLSQLTEEELS